MIALEPFKDCRSEVSPFLNQQGIGWPDCDEENERVGDDDGRADAVNADHPQPEEVS